MQGPHRDPSPFGTSLSSTLIESQRTRENQAATNTTWRWFACGATPGSPQVCLKALCRARVPDRPYAVPPEVEPHMGLSSCTQGKHRCAFSAKDYFTPRCGECHLIISSRTLHDLIRAGLISKASTPTGPLPHHHFPYFPCRHPSPTAQHASLAHFSFLCDEIKYLKPWSIHLDPRRIKPLRSDHRASHSIFPPSGAFSNSTNMGRFQELHLLA